MAMCIQTDGMDVRVPGTFGIEIFPSWCVVAQVEVAQRWEVLSVHLQDLRQVHLSTRESDNQTTFSKLHSCWELILVVL